MITNDKKQELIDALIEEYAPNSHDIDEAIRNMGLEIKRLKICLEYISNPVEGMRKQAEAEGHILNAQMALRIANDPEHLRSMAKNALCNAVVKCFHLTPPKIKLEVSLVCLKPLFNV